MKNKSKLKINSINGPIEIFGVSGISDVKISGEKKVDSDSEADAEAHLRKLDVKPEEAIMVGNTISTDIFGGNRIGMKTVLIQKERVYRGSEWEKADHVIHSLKELLKLPIY